MIERSSRSAFLAGLGTVTLARRAGAQTPPASSVVRLGATFADDGTPIVYGQKAGIFAKYGVELQLTRMTSGSAITAGMLAGTFDLGKSSITTLLEAHEKGLPITLVAGASVHNPRVPFSGFLLRKDAPAEAGKDFNNQLVGVAALGDIGNVAMLKWVDEHGGDAKTVKFIEIPTSTAIAAIDQGRVFATESSYPVIAAALETGRMRMAPIFDALGNGSLQVAWATTKEFSARRPELVRAFVRAWNESAAYTNAHHAETVAMMAEFTGMSADIIAKMPRATAGTSLVPAQIQPVIEASVKYGWLKRSFPAAEMIDPNAR